jgi:hypothetical protein
LPPHAHRQGIDLIGQGHEGFVLRFFAIDSILNAQDWPKAIINAPNGVGKLFYGFLKVCQLLRDLSLSRNDFSFRFFF